MKLCDGDCTIKKEIGNDVSFSSVLLQANVKDAMAYFMPSGGEYVISVRFQFL